MTNSLWIQGKVASDIQIFHNQNVHFCIFEIEHEHNLVHINYKGMKPKKKFNVVCKAYNSMADSIKKSIKEGDIITIKGELTKDQLQRTIIDIHKYKINEE